jgi:hypothetical protein
VSALVILLSMPTFVWKCDERFLTVSPNAGTGDTWCPMDAQVPPDSRVRRKAVRLLRAVANSLDRSSPAVASDAIQRLGTALEALEQSAARAFPATDTDVVDGIQHLTRLLPDPVVPPTPTIAAGHDEDDILDLALALFREAAIAIGVCGSTYRGPGPRRLNRKQAICAGLVIRMVKLLRGILAVVEGDAPRDVVMVLDRCVFETATNLRFLLSKYHDDSLFERFVARSLGTERELYELIRSNIRARNDLVLPIETRMLTSIENVCGASGLHIHDVPTKHSDWGGGLRHRCEALEIGERYVCGQRMPSHATHGTWVDLIVHHLNGGPDHFSIEPRYKTSDPRLLIPTAAIAIEAATHYVLALFPWDAPDAIALADRLDGLQRRMAAIDSLHENLTHRDFLTRAQNASES